MKRLAFVATLLLAACSGSSSPPVPPAQTATPADSGRITAEEFGNDWPFIVPAGTLACYPSGDRLLVTFNTGDGIEYGINGSARDFGFPDPDKTLVTDYPDLSGLSVIIERGLRLCD